MMRMAETDSSSPRQIQSTLLCSEISIKICSAPSTRKSSVVVFTTRRWIAVCGLPGEHHRTIILLGIKILLEGAF
jgi:hypothetical protein